MGSVHASVQATLAEFTVFLDRRDHSLRFTASSCAAVARAPAHALGAHLFRRSGVAAGRGTETGECRRPSHRQNDTELCLAAEHARVSLGRFFQRIGFNHGTHAA
jgi:hypothetical protein